MNRGEQMKIQKLRSMVLGAQIQTSNLCP